MLTLGKIFILVSLVVGGPRPDYQEVSMSTDDEDLRYISSRINITHDVTWEEYLAEAFNEVPEEKHFNFDEDSGDYSGSGWASGDDCGDDEIKKTDGPVIA